MKKRYFFPIVLLVAAWLFSGASICSADVTVYGKAGTIKTTTECNAAAYYPIGTLCQDTDDGKLYKGTGSAVEEVAAGTGDVTGVGDCAGGACGDGSSDGGTYIRLYDGTSAYTGITAGVRTLTLAPSNTNAENVTITFGDNNNAVAIASGTGASVSINGNAGTATALAANGANCDAGNYPLGVDASGAVESCTAAPTAASLHVDDILTALGIASEAVHFGTFTGSTITDNQTAKAAIQLLETAVETKQATDAELTAIAGLTFADVSVIQLTGAAAAAVLTSGGNNYILGSNSDNSALEFKAPDSVLSQIAAQASDADLAAIAALSCTENQIIKKGAAAWECGADADTGGSTELDDIGDPSADGSVTQAGYKMTWTSSLDSGAIWTHTNTDASHSAAFSFFDFAATADGDANCYVFRGYDNVTDLKWSLTCDGTLSITSIVVAASESPTTLVLDSNAPGTDKEIAKLVGAYVDGADGAENGTYSLYVHEGGTSTEYIQLDGKNTDIELKKNTLLASTMQLQFGDSGTYINQSTDGTLNIVADTIAQVVAPNIKLAFDAAAYINVAVADGGAGTISMVSDGADTLNVGDSSDDQPRVRMTLNATDATWSGNTLYFAQCAASMGFGAPAYIQSTGKPGLADADAAATMPAIGVVVVASTDADTPCTILTHGVITETDWNWTPGNTIYVADGDAGALTATVADISDTNDVVQVIGIAIHADSIFVNPSLTTIVLE